MNWQTLNKAVPQCHCEKRVFERRSNLLKSKFYLASLTLFLALSISTTVLAIPQEIYHFDNPQQSQQFQSLLSQLRCLVCQNQDLKDSQAALAEDLRQEVYHQVKLGYPTPQIKTYLTQRYGNFILFNPPFLPQTYLLWLGPWFLLVFSIMLLSYIVFRHQRAQSL